MIRRILDWLKSLFSFDAERCSNCGSVFGDDILLDDNEQYCSIDCYVEATDGE